MDETSQPEARNLAVVRAYLDAVADPAETMDSLGRFLHPDIVQEELPNMVAPRGITRDWAAMKLAHQRGSQVIRNQRYQVLDTMACGDRVAVRVLWTGTLLVPYGSRLPGAELRAHMGAFFRLRDGRVAEQRNYDCYEP